MSYDIGIWEQIRSTVQWKTCSLESDISREISTDRSLRDFDGLYPVPWQLREVLKQRGNNWIHRLYSPCCDIYRNSGKEISLEFDLAIWAFWIEPFITREVQTTEDGYRASKLMELLLCAIGSTPEKRRSLRVGHKDCCVAVRNELCQTWHDKLHHRPSRIEEAARAISAYNATQARAARIVRGLPPEPSETPNIVTPAPPPPIPAVSARPFGAQASADSPIPKLSDAEEQPAPSAQIVTPKNSAAKNWQGIEILFISDHRLQIKVNGKSMETLNFTEFGFADGRTHIPNKAWELLLVLAEQRGTIRDGKVVGEPWSKVEKRIQDIRRVLRVYFGLSDDPIPFVEGTGYQTLFKIKCTPSFRT